jgi:DNA polymerase-3 subunit delta'
MARLINSVRGHREVWDMLLRQISTGRLPHAMAFTGPSGIGKKAVAWARAQRLICEHQDAAPCGQCGSCRRVAGHSSENVLFIEPQKGAIRLEASALILDFLVLRLVGRARVILIDGAQLLNPQAANALLKAIEEPPDQTYFILITPEISQLIPTLRSRVQVIRFTPLSEAELQADEKIPDWQLNASRGSFEVLESFRDPQMQELRAQVLGFLTSSVSGSRLGLDAILNLARDREAALHVTHHLQSLLRDWSVLESGRLLHSDLKSQFEALPGRPVENRLRLWHKAFQMEQDVKANVDRGLIFENFFYEAKS